MIARMETGSNLLSAARPHSLSPYSQISSVAGVSSLANTSPQEPRRTLNGWANYPNDAVVAHSTCNFSPYASSLTPSNSLSAHGPSHKPGYSSFGPLPDIGNCQQLQMNHLNPLPGARNAFPFGPYDMYTQHPPSVTGSSLFTPDLPGMPGIRPFEPDGPGAYMPDSGSQNPGR